MKKYGLVGFWTGLCPPLEISFGMKIVLVPMILVLEIVGMVIRYSVLAVRLLANMFGGHLGLAIIVGFIPAVAGSLHVVRRHADGRGRRHGHQHAGAVCGLLAGVYFRVPGGVVHRHGRSSTLKKDCCRGEPSRLT